MAKLKSSGHRVMVTTHAVTRLYQRLARIGNVATSRGDLQRRLAEMTAKALAKGDCQEVIDDGLPTRVVAMTIHDEKLYALVRPDRYGADRDIVITVLDPAMYATNLTTKWKIPMNNPFEKLAGMQIDTSPTPAKVEDKATDVAVDPGPPSSADVGYLVVVDGKFTTFADLDDAMELLRASYGRKLSLWKRVPVAFDVQVKVTA